VKTELVNRIIDIVTNISFAEIFSSLQQILDAEKLKNKNTDEANNIINLAFGNLAIIRDSSPGQNLIKTVFSDFAKLFGGLNFSKSKI
jgi:hypothetical protein